MSNETPKPRSLQSQLSDIFYKFIGRHLEWPQNEVDPEREIRWLKHVIEEVATIIQNTKPAPIAEVHKALEQALPGKTITGWSLYVPTQTNIGATLDTQLTIHTYDPNQSATSHAFQQDHYIVSQVYNGHRPSPAEVQPALVGTETSLGQLCNLVANQLSITQAGFHTRLLNKPEARMVLNVTHDLSNHTFPLSATIGITDISELGDPLNLTDWNAVNGVEQSPY